MKVHDRRRVGHTRLELTLLGLGAAVLGGLYEAVDAASARGVLQAAWDAGLRYVDTAPFYGYTLSERRTGEFLAARPRGEFVLSTKVGRLMRPDATVTPGLDGWADPLPFRPVFDYGHDAILRSFDDSLQRLGLARIDMLLVHDIGRLTHGDRHAHHWHALTAGGGFRALEALRREGRVGAIGLGVNECEVAFDAMNEAPLDCVLLAGRYTLLEQGSLGLLDACARAGASVVIGGPFNSGLLAGQAKFNYADVPPDVMQRATALQFPLGHPAVACVLSGMRSAEQVRANAAWFESAIPAALWAELRRRGLLDEAAPAPPEGPA